MTLEEIYHYHDVQETRSHWTVLELILLDNIDGVFCKSYFESKKNITTMSLELDPTGTYQSATMTITADDCYLDPTGQY